MKSLKQAVANRGWTVRPISISRVAQTLSLGRPVSLTLLIAKCFEPVPQIVRLSLQRVIGDPIATHAGSLSGPANRKIKTIKNKEQFFWWLIHSNGDPPISQEARIEAGQVKTVPWAGMYVSGPYRGNYNIGDPKPQTLTIEIEIES